MFSTLEIAVGGAGLAAIIAGWTTFVGFLDTIRSVLITRIKVCDEIDMSFKKYVLLNFKEIKCFSNKTYTGRNEYIRSMEKWQKIVYEKVAENFKIYYNGWKIIVLRHRNGNSWDPLEVFFLKWQFNPDDLMKEVADYHNHVTYKDSNRFITIRMCGDLNKSKSIENTQDRENFEDDEANDGDAWWRTQRLINFTEDEIEGPPCNKDIKTKLFFPDSIWENIKDIERWKNSEDWYKEKGIPWKRGWILHGIPGTGKTSLAKSIGIKFDMPIFIFDLSTFNNVDFYDKWKDVKFNTPCIALFEDIDSIFNKEKNILSKKGITWDCFINCIDGVEDSDGIFTIITTNHIDKIGTALIGLKKDGSYTARPGRIDKAIKLGYLENDDKYRLARKILTSEEDVLSVVDEDENITPAELQERCRVIALKKYWENKV